MLKRMLTEIREKRADREQKIRPVKGLETILREYRDSSEEPSFETKQQVLWLVDERTVIEDARVLVHHIVPTGPIGMQTQHPPRYRAFHVSAAGAILHVEILPLVF